MRIEGVRADLVTALQVRMPEIEQATLVRISAVSEPEANAEPEYLHGLREVVRAALEFGLEALLRCEEIVPPFPTTLLAQARLAARAGVSLDTVMRRYIAGYTVLGDYVIEQAEGDRRLDRADLRDLLRRQATLLDRLLEVIGEEYARERGGRPIGSEERMADRVRSLLAGELVDTADLRYEFDLRHLGILAQGPQAATAIREVAAPLDCQLLVVRREEAITWAWLGSRRGISPDEVRRAAAGGWPAGNLLALGEPSDGLEGWRLSHRQARAALTIAKRSDQNFVRYADVALLASVLKDDLLLTSLRELYLEPLRNDRDGGERARQTLRAYYAAHRNISSAASALGVNRHTVASRLRSIEDRIGRSIDVCATELEAALQVDEIDLHSHVG
jgi:PucR C-terminal helix-turn-helix domain